MLRLHTFGGVGVVDDHNEPLAGATDQRRPLAIVIAVAVSGRQGITRDKLASLLWPEVDPERARHSLTQSLYAARRAFQTDDLFQLDGSIRLNPARISSDVAEFSQAVGAGELENAVALYTGPFLDGFFVSSAREFDQWASARRLDLEESFVTSLGELVGAAERANQIDRAVQYQKRIAATRPLDVAATHKLASLLAAVGNRGEAIRQVERHALLVREQLDLAPDAAMMALLERLRAAPSAGATVAEPATLHVASLDVGQEEDGARTDRRARAFKKRRQHSMPLAVLVCAVVTFVVIGEFRWHGGIATRTGGKIVPKPPVATGAARRAYMVAPFSASGASSNIAYVGGAIAALLPSHFDLDSSVRTIDPGTVRAAWHARGFDRQNDVALDSVLAIARGVGASRVVVGSVVGTRAGAVLSASILSVRTGKALARATLEGAPDSIRALVGELAARLLVSEAGESRRIAEGRGQSLPALRLFLAGRVADRRGDYASAAHCYLRALALDSRFAMAALRLAIAADRLGNAELLTESVARAWMHRESLASGDRVLLTALAGPRYPQPSLVTDQVHAWGDVPRHDPSSAVAWYELGARLFHDGDRLGSSGASGQTLVALKRAIVLDRGYLPAQWLLAVAGSRGGDSGLVDARSHGLETATATTVRAIAMTSLWDGRHLPDARRAIAAMRALPATTEEAIDVALAAHSLALNEGHSVEALEWTRRLSQLRPDSHAGLRLRVLDALYGDGDSASAEAAAAQLTQAADTIFDSFPMERGRRAADGCVTAQWRLAHADTAGVSAAIRFLRDRPIRDEPPPVSALPGACANLLEAGLAVTTHSPGALRRVQHVDSLMMTPAVAGNAAGYAHILIARLYERLGHRHHALAAIRKRDYMIGWPAYLATTWREEWRLANSVGDHAGALRAQRAFAALRSRSAL